LYTGIVDVPPVFEPLLPQAVSNDEVNITTAAAAEEGFVRPIIRTSFPLLPWFWDHGLFT
jgi:uncharacterized membrane protein